jgi:hypothetical protein
MVENGIKQAIATDDPETKDSGTNQDIANQYVSFDSSFAWSVLFNSPASTILCRRFNIIISL